MPLAFPGYALRRHRCRRVHRLATPAHAPRARARRDGLGRVHRLLRPCAEGGERARTCRSSGSTSARTRSTLDGRRRCLPSRGAAGREELRQRVPASTFARTSSRASGSSRRRLGLASARCSRPRRRSTETLLRIRRRRTPFHGPSRPTASRSSPASTWRRRTGRSSASMSSRSGTSRSTVRASVPTWRSRAWSLALAENRAFELFGDGTQSRSFTYVDDAVEATIGAMEQRSSGSTSMSAGARRSRCSRPSRPSARSPGGVSRSSGRRAAREMRRERRRTRRGSSARSAGRRRTSFEEGLTAQWRWAADRVAAA